MLKRYLLALLGFVAVSATVGMLSELLSPLFAPSTVFTSAEDIEAWQKRAFLGLNSLTAVQNLLAFGVGAFLLRRNPLLPGLLLSFALAAASLRILYRIAVPADPFVTYLDIVSSNSVGWISGFLAAVVGMLVGYRIAQRRRARSDAL